MRRVLVVDDAEINREVLSNILADDYAVDTASDGEEALDILQRNRTDTAAVLLDLYMPKMDGFAVINVLKDKGWLQKIPVLVITSEPATEIENRCLEMGASDFIHKPFEASVVRNRVRNVTELFVCKNKLEQKVEEQEEVLKKQYRIIEMQAEKLRESVPFNRLMMEYRSAIMEVETRLKILNEEFSQVYNRNPFESIKSRLKSPTSIYEKLALKGYPVTVESIREHLTDVAGLRVICSFPDDIYRLADLLIKQDEFILVCKKDYIRSPKNNGYRSLHLILDVPIFLSNEKKYVKAEVQFRTIAMDFWASLEHKLKYKKDVANTEEIEGQLRACADSIEMLDYQMQDIRNKIDRSTPSDMQVRGNA